MCAFGRLAVIQQSDMFVKMCFPFLSIEKLLNPRGSSKRRIAQAERTIPRAGKGFIVDKRVALDGKRFRPFQVAFAVIVPFVLADNSLTTVEAQLGKPVAGHELLFVAAIDVPSSLCGRFAMGKNLVSRLTCTQGMKRGRGSRTYQASACGLSSGMCISSALSSGGRELRRPVDKARSCHEGWIDLRRYGSKRQERD